MNRINSFTNHDGQCVHAVEVDEKSSDGRGLIGVHYGTFATRREAERQLEMVENGTWRDDGVD